MADGTGVHDPHSPAEAAAGSASTLPVASVRVMPHSRSGRKMTGKEFFRAALAVCVSSLWLASACNTSTVQCTSNAQCARGVCLGGVCTELDAEPDSDGDVAADVVDDADRDVDSDAATDPLPDSDAEGDLDIGSDADADDGRDADVPDGTRDADAEADALSDADTSLISGPALRLEGCPADLGLVVEGETGEASITITNIGDEALSWSVALVGLVPASARDQLDLLDVDGRSVAGEQPALAPDASATLRVSYVAADELPVTGGVRIAGNFGESRSCEFSIGPAVPVIVVSPWRLYWSGQFVGVPSERSFVIANRGAADLVVRSVDLTDASAGTPQFSVSPLDAAGFVVRSGGARRVVVTYERATTVPAPDNARIEIDHNDTLTVPSVVLLQTTHDPSLPPPDCDLLVSAGEPITVGSSISVDASGTVAVGDTMLGLTLFSLATPLGSRAALIETTERGAAFEPDVPGTYEVAQLTYATSLLGEMTSCEARATLEVVE